MFTWKRLLYTFLLIVVLCFGFVTLILPGIVIDRAQDWVADEMDRSLHIGSISINPLALTVAVRDLSLSEADNITPFISWHELRVSLSSSSLFRWAPIVDEFQLDTPYLHIERLAENRFNFSEIIPESKEQGDTKSDSEPFRFSLNNLTLNNGRIELVDHNLDQEVKHVIRDLDLALPAIGNLAYMVENPVQPMLYAVVNDAPVDIKGTFKPFIEGHEMRFNLSLANIDLPFYLGYLPMELPVQLRNGHLGFDLDLVYRLTVENGPELEVAGHVDLSALDIWDRQNEQLFFMPLLQVDIAPTRPLAKDIHLSSLRIYNLEVQLNRDRQGVWNHSRLKMTDEQPDKPEQSDEEPTQPIKLLLDNIKIRDGVVNFRDDIPTGGFQTTARDINIDLENFALDTSEPIPLSMSLETKFKEKVKVTGHFLLDPFTLSLQSEFADLPLAVYQPYYYETYAGPLGGVLSAQARVDISPEQPFLLSQTDIQWHNAYMAFNENEGLGVGLFNLDNLSFNLAENRLEIDSARYDKGAVKFSRSDDGHWSFLSRNFPILAKLTEAPDEQPPAEETPEGPVFNYLIRELSITNTKFDIIDRLPETPVQLMASDFNLKFQNLAAPEEVQSPFEFSTIFNQQGKIKLKGEASLAAQTVSLNTSLTSIPLPTFAPYVSEQTNIILKQGELNATLKTSVAAGSDPPQVNFVGNLGISRFHLLDGTHREDLLKWDNLLISGVQGKSAPAEITINSITLNDYFAKFLIDEDARLNLTEALRKAEPETEESVDNQNEAVEEQVTEEPSSPRPKITINTVVLQGGQIDFTDRSLLNSFHADMRELGGRISGLSSDPDSRAVVDLRGSLRQQSPLEISGTVNPLAEQLALDLKLDFHDIELGPMSPYSGTYVGYLIEKGKLNLALEYQVENDQLKASNNVFLDQFTLGESVESDKATGLPVKLAVALLKDSNGEIHLDIPVSGNLDDPQFSIGGVIWTIIKNLLVKAATSPMALLGSLFGGADEDFSSVSFVYGSVQLAPPEQEKLQRIAEALNDRPSLKIEIKGYVDPENDPEGFRREQLHMSIQRAKYGALKEEDALADGMMVESIEVSAEEYPEFLWQVYKAADFPKPRNFIGMTKKIPVEEQEKLIYTNTDAGPEQLAKLAQARSQNVLTYLIEEQQLASERAFLTTVDIETPPERNGATRSRVELEVSVD